MGSWTELQSYLAEDVLDGFHAGHVPLRAAALATGAPTMARVKSKKEELKVTFHDKSMDEIKASMCINEVPVHLHHLLQVNVRQVPASRC